MKGGGAKQGIRKSGNPASRDRLFSTPGRARTSARRKLKRPPGRAMVDAIKFSATFGVAVPAPSRSRKAGPVINPSRKESAMRVVPLNRRTVLARCRSVLRLATLSRGELRRMSGHEFRRAWSATCFVFPGLHPDGALDHGRKTEVSDQGTRVLPELYPVVARFYVRSGWPVALANAAAEAWRRYECGELSDAEFYDANATREGVFGRRVASRSGA